MPWKPSDAPSHTKKAVTAKQKRQWADVANAEKKAGATDAVAIKAANGVLKDPKRKA